MENYKSEYHNPETFEKSEIETTIPDGLVREIKQTLNNIEGYMITPAMVNPEGESVVFGIMNMTDRTLKYKLSITTNN
jgi:hypothetical protein